VDCFTQDGAFQMVEVHGADKTVRVRHDGREKLAGFIPGHTSAPLMYHKHLTTVPIIAIDGDTADVRSYFCRIDAGESGPYVWSFGQYLDRLQRCADGRWRVAERVLEVESRAKPVRAGDVGAGNAPASTTR
jgi:hypothetical protein